MTGETFKASVVLIKPLVRLDLTFVDAERFKKFQEIYDRVVPLLDAGVFETKNGWCRLSFDREGRLMEIEKNEKIYKHLTDGAVR